MEKCTEKLRITVFTPTYNRAHSILKLYQSLKKQSFHNFEWLVVDDGSADNTEELFDRIRKENNGFPVRYFRTENGGKHRAVNRGVKEARGELFFIVDSDDYLPDDSLQKIDCAEKTIPLNRKPEFAGICGLKIQENGQCIGKSANREVLDITSLERGKYGITGDKSEVFYTKVIGQYPFPTFENEKFITEAVVWNQIAADGLLLRFIQEPLMICEYLPDGLTARIRNLRAENPWGHGLYLSQQVRYGQLKGREKWDCYREFYYLQRDKMSYKTMSQCLHCGTLYLQIGLLIMRIYQKLTGG